MLNLPISNIFWERKIYYQGESFEMPISFQEISLRVQRNNYKSIDEFKNDIQLIINDLKYVKRKNPMLVICSSIMQEEFDQLLQLYSDKSSKIKIEETKLDLYFQNINLKLDELKNSTLIDTKTGTEYASYVLSKDPKSYSPQDLAGLLKIIKDSEIITKIAAFVFNIQPEAISINQGLSFHISLINSVYIPGIVQYACDLLKGIDNSDNIQNPIE